MPVYTRSQPVAGDDLDVSQPFLANNTNAADDIFGIDHYPFFNTTSSQGFHNTVTTPAYNNPLGTVSATIPVTTVNPVIFAFTPSANVGLIQYSGGVSGAIPSPLTSLQSPSSAITLASGSTSNILDFTSLPRAIVKLIATNVATPQVTIEYTVVWTGMALLLSSILTGSLLAQSSGAVLQIKNNSGSTMSNIYWTLQLWRTS